MIDPEILAQRLFQLLVERTTVREYLVIPDFLQVWKKVFQRRQMGLSDIDRFLVAHIFGSMTCSAKLDDCRDNTWRFVHVLRWYAMGWPANTQGVHAQVGDGLAGCP